MLGFTDHDQPLSFDSLRYEAASGFTASEVQSNLDLSVDNLTVAGALSSASLNEVDLAAGLFDAAAIEIWRRCSRLISVMLWRAVAPSALSCAAVFRRWHWTKTIW